MKGKELSLIIVIREYFQWIDHWQITVSNFSIVHTLYNTFICKFDQSFLKYIIFN